jgi:hypothetical protein
MLYIKPECGSFGAVGPEGGLDDDVLPHLLPEDRLVPQQQLYRRLVKSGIKRKFKSRFRLVIKEQNM